MRLVIVGAGAIGSLLGGLLSEIGVDVTLVGRPLHVKAMRSKGLHISGVTGRKTIKIRAEIDTSRIREQADVVLCTVKAYDTKQAAIDAKRLVGRQSLFLCMQNGLDVEKEAAEILGEPNVGRGVTNNGALTIKPGYIRHTGLGETIVGCADDRLENRIGELADAMNAAGLPTKCTDNISEVVWTKVLVNVGINAIGAITRLRNGDLVSNPYLRNLMRSAAEEGISVAEKSGIRLEDRNIAEMIISVARATAQNKNSMLQDVEKGKRTEIDFINGAIVRIGKRIGVPTPINEALAALVKAMEASAANSLQRQR